MGKFLFGPFAGYQRMISRYTPPSCRYHPSCSQYPLEAIRVHGVFKGTWLGSLQF